MPLRQSLLNGAGATLGLLALAGLSMGSGYDWVIGSFAATVVLLFGAPESPLSQPRNLLGGHAISAIIAVLVVMTWGDGHVAASVAVGLSVLVMNATRTTHPPGGATALIGVEGAAGPEFVVIPILTGALVLLVIAAVASRLGQGPRYPAASG